MCGRYRLSRRKQIIEEHQSRQTDFTNGRGRVRQNSRIVLKSMTASCLRSQDCGTAWKDPSGQWIKSCSILTTTPNAVTSAVHDRMPVILDSDIYDLWLDPGMRNVSAMTELLKPYDPRIIRCYPVSNRLNHVANDDAECSMPAAFTETQAGLFPR